MLKQQAPSTVAHWPELDGLRGVAILLVFGFHWGYHFGLANAPKGTASWLVGHAVQAGWCGVDLFFVLSGFLITDILMKTRGKANYYSAFYARRALRIMPLYYALMMARLFLLPLLPVKLCAILELGEMTGGEATAYLTYLANWWQSFGATGAARRPGDGGHLVALCRGAILFDLAVVGVPLFGASLISGVRGHAGPGLSDSAHPGGLVGAVLELCRVHSDSVSRRRLCPRRGGSDFSAALAKHECHARRAIRWWDRCGGAGSDCLCLSECGKRCSRHGRHWVSGMGGSVRRHDCVGIAKSI